VTAIAETVQPCRCNACTSMSISRVHEQQEPLRAGAWSKTASIEGVPPVPAEPHGWGISVSRSGEIQMSAISSRETASSRIAIKCDTAAPTAHPFWSTLALRSDYDVADSRLRNERLVVFVLSMGISVGRATRRWWRQRGEDCVEMRHGTVWCIAGQFAPRKRSSAALIVVRIQALTIWGPALQPSSDRRSTVDRCMSWDASA
jgi:hypothetical protein